jgi:hypothetical protein
MRVIKRNKLGEFKSHNWLTKTKIKLNNGIMKLWEKYLRNFLIGFLLISIGITGTINYLLLSATKIVKIQIADASEVSVVADVVKTVSVASPVSDTRPQAIEELVTRYFGSESKTAIAIMMCESSGDSQRIGDTHISFWNNGELLGRSIGLFQIRTGGNEHGVIWNRAKANGMTVTEFEAKMKNPEENIKYAKKIYDKSGWQRWACFTNGNYKQFLN